MEDLEKEYLSLIEKIKEERESLEEDDELLFILQKKANELFIKIKNTSELKLDAKFLKESSKILANKFTKNRNNAELSSRGFIKFIDQEGDAFFDFISSNIDRGLTLKIPKILKQPEVVERKKSKEKKNKFKEEAIEAVEKVHIKEEEDIIQKRIKQIIKITKEKKKIDFFELVLDPMSFSKTVENIFYLAFANKTKVIKIIEENKKIFVISVDANESKENDSENSVGEHFICNIEQYEYEKLIRKLNIKKALLED